MKIYSRYKTDEDAELNGTWVDLGDGAQVKVARFGNAKHREIIAKLQKPYAGTLKAGLEIPEEAKMKMAVESIATSILLDWRGIEDENGSPLPYSLDNARKLLNDLKDFRDTVTYLAMQQETFRQTALEQAAKNSEPASGGGSNGADTSST